MKRDVEIKRKLFLSVLLIGFLVIGMIGVVIGATAPAELAPLTPEILNNPDRWNANNAEGVAKHYATNLDAFKKIIDDPQISLGPGFSLVWKNLFTKENKDAIIKSLGGDVNRYQKIWTNLNSETAAKTFNLENKFFDKLSLTQQIDFFSLSFNLKGSDGKQVDGNAKTELETGRVALLTKVAEKLKDTKSSGGKKFKDEFLKAVEALGPDGKTAFYASLSTGTLTAPELKSGKISPAARILATIGETKGLQLDPEQINLIGLTLTYSAASGNTPEKLYLVNSDKSTQIDVFSFTNFVRGFEKTNEGGIKLNADPQFTDKSTHSVIFPKGMGKMSMDNTFANPEKKTPSAGFGNIILADGRKFNPFYGEGKQTVTITNNNGVLSFNGGYVKIGDRIYGKGTGGFQAVASTSASAPGGGPISESPLELKLSADGKKIEVKGDIFVMPQNWNPYGTDKNYFVVRTGELTPIYERLPSPGPDVKGIAINYDSASKKFEVSIVGVQGNVNVVRGIGDESTEIFVGAINSPKVITGRSDGKITARGQLNEIRFSDGGSGFSSADTPATGAGAGDGAAGPTGPTVPVDPNRGNNPLAEKARAAAEAVRNRLSGGSSQSSANAAMDKLQSTTSKPEEISAAMKTLFGTNVNYEKKDDTYVINQGSYGKYTANRNTNSPSNKDNIFIVYPRTREVHIEYFCSQCGPTFRSTQPLGRI